MVYHYFDPCGQKYTINIDNPAADSTMLTNTPCVTLSEKDICFNFYIETSEFDNRIFKLTLVGAYHTGNIFRNRSISEILQIETSFEEMILSKLGSWEKHYMQGFCSFLAIRSIDYNLPKIFGYYIVVLSCYLLVKFLGNK